MTCPNVAIAMTTVATPDLAATLARDAGHIVVSTVYAAASFAGAVKGEFDEMVRRRNAQLAVATLLQMRYQFDGMDGSDAVFSKSYATGESVVTVAMTNNGVRVYIDRQRGDMRGEQVERCTRESFQIAKNLRGAPYLPTLPQAEHLLDPGVLVAHRRERLPMPTETREVCVVTGEFNTIPTRTLADTFGVPVADSPQTLVELFSAVAVTEPLPIFESVMVR